MELLKTPSSRGLRFGDALYVGANAAFVFVLALLIFVWQLEVLAFILAFLSKWRILAVRPRYWSANLRSNLPDLIFVVGTVSLAISPLAVLPAQIGWLSLLAIWLLAIKPRSTQSMMLLQAAGSQFIGMTALLSYASLIPINQLYTIAIVVGAWLIGYAAARHAISSYESEPKIEFLALFWGLITAQLTWLFSHWLQVYSITAGFGIPQIALIMLLLSFCAQRVYALQRHILEHDDPNMRKAATKRVLKSAYAAAGFSLSLIAFIMLTTSWTVTI